MQIADLIQTFEEWAPKWVAWERDNVGLQVGNEQHRVTKVLVTLDVTRQTVNEAITRKAELIVSHHPLLFRAPSSITTNDSIGELVLQLAENGISLFSAHTNLDFAPDGVSFVLAHALGVKDTRFLTPLRNSLAKIVVFVPIGHEEHVMQTMAQAGAGIIGKYVSCSFSTRGRGSFFGTASSNPFTGTRGTLESVEEARLEMITPRARISEVVAAMKTAHPYEEVAYDVYNLENANPNFGMGVIGELQTPQSLHMFLRCIKRALGCETLRFTGDVKRKIHRVAVCSGAGSDLISDAIAANADIFVTGDVRYHAFVAASNQIALVDAGHWETERVILGPITDKIRSAAEKANERVSVFISKYAMNPIQTI